MQSVLGHDVPHEPINWRGRSEAIRRLLEIALTAKSKRQSNRGEK
jgi:metal-responsive CopG/Arc/MetJ family transcriptional regulator